MGIFPEGGVNKEGRLQEGNPGIGFPCHKKRRTRHSCLYFRHIRGVAKGAKIPKISRIKIIFGKPMTFKPINEKADQKGIVEVTRQIMEQIEALSFSVRHLIIENNVYFKRNEKKISPKSQKMVSEK